MREIGREYRLKQPNISAILVKKRKYVSIFVIELVLSEGERQLISGFLSRHKDKIINYFRNRLTNAICEGINSMIQAAKRKARGYHTFEGFANMIYIVAGKLDIESPFPMLS